jgi:hypothetical protein
VKIIRVVGIKKMIRRSRILRIRHGNANKGRTRRKGKQLAEAAKKIDDCS